MDRSYAPYRFVIKYSILLGVLLVFFSWAGVTNAARSRQYNSVSEVPFNRVGLLLGTSQYSRSGGPNRFFWNRVDAAAELYHAGKVEIIIASGDNRFASYNEPEAMRRALLERDVPDEAVVLDAAGFNTFDSVLRSNLVFGQTHLTIVSQPFHNARAVFIAVNNGIDAVGYSAADVPLGDAFGIYVREYFARVKAIIDVYVLRREPRVIDDPIDIDDARRRDTQPSG